MQYKNSRGKTYVLCRKTNTLASGAEQETHFFCLPEKATEHEEDSVPRGYRIDEFARNGVPHLKRQESAWQDPGTAAARVLLIGVLLIALHSVGYYVGASYADVLPFELGYVAGVFAVLLLLAVALRLHIKEIDLADVAAEVF